MGFCDAVSRVWAGLVLARNLANDAGDFPGDSGHGVHPGLHRAHPSFPDLGCAIHDLLD